LNINYIQCHFPATLSSQLLEASRICRNRTFLCPLITPSLRKKKRTSQNFCCGKSLWAHSRNSNKKKIRRTKKMEVSKSWIRM